MPISQCQAIAQRLPGATFASFKPSDLQVAQAKKSLSLSEREEVKITFIGHSTYFIETPGGVGIATDFSGDYMPPRLPDVVTMNRAHSTHYTLHPDPGIQHVLHGWSDTPGDKITHQLMVGDVYIRNVMSDIRSWGGGIEQNGNSIFIFEVAGLCIGHLGHLHFELNESQYTQIGRLDILMVPVDGGLTMGADSMSRVVQRLRSSLILPMHRFGPPLDNFPIDVQCQVRHCLCEGTDHPRIDADAAEKAYDTSAAGALIAPADFRDVLIGLPASETAGRSGAA